MHEAVEPAELAFHPGGERFVVGRHRPGEVHRIDGGLRAVLGPYRVVDPFELLDGAPEEHHDRGVGRARAGDRPSDPVAGPGDEDHAPFEEVRGGAEIGKAGIESHEHGLPGFSRGGGPRPEDFGGSSPDSAGRRYQAR